MHPHHGQGPRVRERKKRMRKRKRKNGDRTGHATAWKALGGERERRRHAPSQTTKRSEHMMMMMKKKNRQQASELCREEELFGKSQGGLESRIETSRGRKEVGVPQRGQRRYRCTNGGRRRGPGRTDGRAREEQ